MPGHFPSALERQTVAQPPFRFAALYAYVDVDAWSGILQEKEYRGAMRQQLVLPLLVVFLFVSVFGMYAMFAHAGHDVDCPFMPSALACATSFVGHLGHWQVALATVVEMVVLAALVLFRPWSALYLVPERARYRLDFRSTERRRPTLFQELFSRGIHNRKEP